MEEPGTGGSLLPAVRYWTKIKGLGGRIKTVPEDFVVEEVPRPKPGKHLIATMEKRDLNTLDAIKGIARALHVPESSIGYAGLKDRFALTRQTISLEKVGPSLAEKVSENPRLYDFRYGGRIYLGDLEGNKFTVAIRGVAHSEKTIKAMIREFALETLERGIPNYFGEQRFGIGGNNIDAGRAVLNGEAPEGYGSYEKRRLAVNALQSHIFNLALESFLRGKERVKDFEVPVVGYGTRLSSNGIDAHVSEVLKKEGIKPEDFRPAGSKGDVRKGVIRPAISLVAIGKDEMSGGKKVTVSFTLGPGEYATVVLEELMKSRTSG